MAPRTITAREVFRKLKALGDPSVRAAMKRFGIYVENAHGISMPVLHKLAHEIGTNQELAQQLWDSGNPATFADALRDTLSVWPNHCAIERAGRRSVGAREMLVHHAPAFPRAREDMRAAAAHAAALAESHRPVKRGNGG